MNLDDAWKGAMLTGVVGLNFKLVYDGIKSYKYKKNGSDRRKIHTSSPSEFCSEHSDLVKKVNEIHANAEYIRGKVESL